MITAERRHKILEFIQERNYASIEELCDLFDISVPTVHRDLNILEENGFLKKVRGGAVSSLGNLYETSYYNRSHDFEDEKQRIARYALRFVRDDISIMLDNSTTVLALARLLGDFSGLTIITYFEQIIQELSRPRYQIQIVSTGGQLDREHQSLMGPIVENTLKDIYVPLAFISTNSINAGIGLMHPHQDETRRKQLIIDSAEEVILLVDHSKFQRSALHRIAEISTIDHIITDKHLNQETERIIADHGVELHIAD